MKITKDQIEWVKMNQGMLRQFVNMLKDDYFNRVVDEENLQRKEVLSLMVKDLRMAITMIDNNLINQLLI